MSLVLLAGLNISKLSILFLMTTNNVFEFMLSEKEKDKIFLKFCVKVQVFLFNGTSIRKYYCLHCRRLFCRSGFHRHRLRQRIPHEDIHKLAEHFFKHIQIHETRVKTLLEKLESRGLIKTTSRPELPHFFTLPHLQHRQTERRVRPRVQRPVEPRHG